MNGINNDEDGMIKVSSGEIIKFQTARIIHFNKIESIKHMILFFNEKKW